MLLDVLQGAEAGGFILIQGNIISTHHQSSFYNQCVHFMSLFSDTVKRSARGLLRCLVNAALKR